MSDKKQQANAGSSLDDFLADQGIADNSNEKAIKRVLSYQLEASMKDQKLCKSALAEKMGTSRSGLDRLLDPSNESVTLETLKKAAHATGQRLKLRLVNAG